MFVNRLDGYFVLLGPVALRLVEASVRARNLANSGHSEEPYQAREGHWERVPGTAILCFANIEVHRFGHYSNGPLIATYYSSNVPSASILKATRKVEYGKE